MADKQWPVIKITAEEKRRLRRPWKKTLIIKLLGKSLAYKLSVFETQREMGKKR